MSRLLVVVLLLLSIVLYGLAPAALAYTCPCIQGCEATLQADIRACRAAGVGVSACIHLAVLNYDVCVTNCITDDSDCDGGGGGGGGCWPDGRGGCIPRL